MGSEPSIDDYSEANPKRTKMMEEDGVPAVPLGYRALLDQALEMLGDTEAPDVYGQY